MTKNFKIGAIGAVAALTLASAGAFAQQTANPRVDTSPQMNHEMTRDGGGMMQMMHDPEMRRQMTEMMSNCNRMMDRMNGGMAQGAPRT